MNKRITQLRNQSLEAVPAISLERAQLLTEFYLSGRACGKSVPVTRALAFDYILTNKRICINPGELIVGERGPYPKGTPTYPEICTHTLQDFTILSGREKIPFLVGDDERELQEQTIRPYWHERSIREKIFEVVSPEWQTAYTAGVFTEFMEQRAPGHTVLDDKIYRKGMLDFISEIETTRRHLDFDFDNDPDACTRDEHLQAMAIAAQALIDYAGRHAAELDKLAKTEKSATRRAELNTMAAICRKVPAQKPDTFWETLQYYWFVHLGVITELNTWDSFNPGRLDQHLLPFYQNDLATGRLSRDQIRELLQAFWIKFNNQPAPPKVGVTARESNTYTDFCLINIGGVDAAGNDASNELSYLLLDVIEELRLLQPGSMVQISRKSPDRLLHRALKIIRTGYGQPSLFNTDAIVEEMLRQGKALTDARLGGASGCVETGAFGKESYILTGYFNLVKILEITLNNGLDPRTGRQIGLKTGAPARFGSFEQLYFAFEKQLNHFIDIKIAGNLVIERLWAEHLPAPFMSLLIDDCIARGCDYNAGGARYNTAYIQGVGLGSITDSLAALRFHVYDRRDIAMAELLTALAGNFRDAEPIRATLLTDTPHWGNDDDYADVLAQRVFASFFQAVDGRPTGKGGHFRINLLPTTSHVYFGSVIGATPDGRLAGKPLSEGISPVQGADRKGPTAVLNSAAKIDHLRTGGTLLNQKFTPQLLADEKGMQKVGSLIRTYFRMNGHHIQFNVISAKTLRLAQAHPEEYRDLIVRVAGYSDYFVDLTDELQEEIIRRTEHSGN